MVSNYWNYGYAPKSIGKTTIDWSLIRRTILSPKLVSPGVNGIPSPEGYAVATLIAAVGIDIDTEYGLEESMAYAYNLQGFLIRMPSKNVTYETYKNSCVRNMLHDQQKATIMRGVRIENGEKKAHFWNLDGWLYRTRYIKHITVMVLFLKEDLSDKLLSIAISDGKELQTDIITTEYSI